MGRQFWHPDSDLCDAGLGPEHRGGPRRLLDLGYVAFYAVGAYSYALLSSYFGLSFWILLPLAGILAAFWGVILGFPVLRLRGDYLAIVTLAFGEIIRLGADQLDGRHKRNIRHFRHCQGHTVWLL